MPRQSRIDSPDLLQHVIVRGIEHNKVFYDDIDRSSFIERFRTLLLETATECYAWALLDDHFHLLLIPRNIKLSSFMRRLLTGYAVTFNRRHNRKDRLFQNRYKSTVCEADTYLLELIRYIHLSPIRTGQVKTLENLRHYLWCGHAEILDQPLKTKVISKLIFTLFANDVETAQKQYLQFVRAQANQEKWPDLMGGGLRRSQAGQPRPHEPHFFDERVLGSGHFVQQLQDRGLLSYSTGRKTSLLELQVAVADRYSIPGNQFLQRSRSDATSRARAIFCYCAVRHFGHSGVAVARLLGIGPSSVCRSAQKGERLARSETDIFTWIATLKH